MGVTQQCEGGTETHPGWSKWGSRVGSKTGKIEGAPPLPPLFIALMSPGLTQGLAASWVGLRACRGSLRAAAAGQAGGQTRH